METLATSSTRLNELDRRHVWHPFTQAQTAPSPIPIAHAHGAYLYGEDGKPYLDAISSWWVNLHGHGHPHIVNKIKEQADQLLHVMFADFTHAPAVNLAARLLPLLPGNMTKIFYSDNGSTAVETALKMAFQYWHNRGMGKEKHLAVSLRHSYHGDTFGAMSAAGKGAMHAPFWPYLFHVECIDPPTAARAEDSIHQLKRLLDTGTVSCFIFEPLVLGVGGMRIYPPEGLDALLQLCKQAGVLTIADEVMTGFGRTGPLFACDALSIAPDIICLSKGLTGGSMAMGATACTEEVFKAFLSDDLCKALLHGHSFTGNPLACSSALASLDLLDTPQCWEQRQQIAAMHRSFVSRWHGHPALRRCEALGTLLVVEYADAQPSYFSPRRSALARLFLDQGIVLRPFGNMVHVLPPYCIQPEELHRIYNCLEATFLEET